MNKHHVCTTANGHEVYVQLLFSVVASRLSRLPHLLKLAEEVLAESELNDAIVSIEKDMGRVIGNAEIVETTDTDQTFYAQIVKKDTYLRFVKGKKLCPSQYLTLMLKKEDDGSYLLEDLWIGHTTPATPGAKDEAPESRTFWENHAYVLEEHTIQPRSLTKLCPY